MLRLKALDGIRLSDAGGVPRDDVLSQPLRVALLAYLTCARPLGAHRRDRLALLFWEDSSHESARHALAQAIYGLRRRLGVEVVCSRGTEEVFVDRRYLRSDVGAFWRALDHGELEAAVGLYRTPLLPYFHVRHAAEFDRWLEGERRAIADAAFGAARTLLDRSLAAGEVRSALVWARAAAKIQPLSEAATRWIMALLAADGRRVEALDVFRRHRERLRTELDLQPARETVALAERIRSGDGPDRALGSMQITL